MDFQNEDYKEGWLGGVVRTIRGDLRYLEACSDESMKRERFAIMIRTLDDAVERLELAAKLKAADNERKRQAAMALNRDADARLQGPRRLFNSAADAIRRDVDPIPAFLQDGPAQQ